ncbi:MAG: glucose 1-dehydrogenase [Firmicutes bacterium]|nr:glucose 1-dehydrogenase [Bacillota bacterium]
MELSLRLDGKVAIVTGGANGIGNGMARGLASVGAVVVIADINAEEAEKAAKTIVADGGKAVSYELDVTNSQQFKSVVDSVVEQFGRIDILVNNAGINRRNLCINMPEEDWKKIIDINLTGAWIGSKVVAPIMMAQKSGKIINICSIMGFVSLPELTAYSASKGGIMQLTKALALELVDYNIQVNAVAPAYILTNLTEKLKANKEMYEDLIRRTPMKRFGTIEEVAGPVVFLASDLSNYMTGHTMAVDGGWLAW